MRFLRGPVVFLLSIAMLEVPTFAAAQVPAGRMISTNDAIAELVHQDAKQKVLAYLDRADVQKELIRQGVAPYEASLRIASLSNAELEGVSRQIDLAPAGGDVIVISLGTILVVVLILFLLERI